MLLYPTDEVAVRRPRRTGLSPAACLFPLLIVCYVNALFTSCSQSVWKAASLTAIEAFEVTSPCCCNTLRSSLTVAMRPITGVVRLFLWPESPSSIRLHTAESPGWWERASFTWPSVRSLILPILVVSR